MSNREIVLGSEIAKGCGTFGAGADGAEMIVAEDAGSVAVIEIDLHRIVAYLSRGLSANFWFEHGQRRRRNYCRRRTGMLMFLVAFFVAGSARAFFTQIRKIVVACVTVGPGDVDACATGNVNLDG